MRRIFSGIQPSGVPHIGNYLGALKNWISAQISPEEQHHPLYCIVDMHALTTLSGKADQLQQLSIQSAASLLACGLDPKKCIIYRQSSNPRHTNLAWVLACLSTTGQLGRMTQWKSRAQTHKHTLGLFSYPVLMSADILLYRSTHVPVGGDQMQHLELARDLALMFNRTYATDFMIVPELVLPPKDVCRVMSLREPLEKMSKSSQSEFSTIKLSDNPSAIKSKVLKAVTDMQSRVTFDPDTRPGVSNLVSIYANFSDKSVRDVCQEFEGRTTHQFKVALHDLLIDQLSGFRDEYQRLMDNPSYVLEVLEQGSKQAAEISETNMQRIMEITGLNR